MKRNTRFSPAVRLAFGMTLLATALHAQEPFGERYVLDATVLAEPGIKVHSADFDGDGDLDLVAWRARVNSGTPLLYLENDGFGDFRPGPVTSFPQGIELLLTEDLDGDGDLDLIGTSNRIFSLVLFIQRNDGAGVFTDISPAFGLGRHVDISSGDLDGDGDVDLAIFSQMPTSAYLLRNDGSANFTIGSITAAPSWTNQLATCDHDGDGDLDIIGVDHDRGLLQILVNDGTARFQLVGGPAIGPPPRRDRAPRRSRPRRRSGPRRLDAPRARRHLDGLAVRARCHELAPGPDPRDGR